MANASTAGRGTSGGTSRASHTAALLILAVAVLAGALGSGAAVVRKGPPPLPECFKTGSGYGTCEGMVIPGGGTVEKVTVADKKDEFKLVGPAPLQFKKPVACGDLGCIYNHLNWSVGNGAAVVRGCQTNESTCDVTVAPGTPTWAVVYVRQNNDPKTLWAIWNSGKLKHASLDVKVTPSVASGSMGVGDTMSVKVKVTAVHGAVKAIDLGAGLTASGDAVKITSTPGGLKGFSLGADASRVFSYEVRGESDGKAKLSASASGTTSDGHAVHGSDATTLDVSAKSLVLRLVTTPSRIDLDVDHKGKVEPGEVTAKVIIQNKSASKIEGVQLLSLDPEPIDRTQQLDKLAFERGTFPLKIGTIGPRQIETRTFKLAVTGDGKYQLRALALYDDKAARGGNGRATATGGDFEAVVPLLFYKASRDDENVTEQGAAAIVKGGKTWYISAELRNLSSYQRLCVLPMVPTASGNAMATGPTNIADKSVRASGGPFADALTPGQKVSLQMFVDTSDTGATRGKITLEPDAVRLKPGEKCQEATVKGVARLSGTERRIEPNSTEFGVTVDTSTPLLPPSGLVTNTFGFFGGFGKSLFVDAFEGIYGVFALNHSIGSTIEEYRKETGSLPVAIAYAVTTKAAQLLYTATDVYAQYWRTASEQEKDSLYYRVGNVLANVTNDFFSDATQTVRDGAQPFMADLEKAWATGDDARIWHLYGEIGGHVAGLVAPMFLEALGAQIVKTAPELEKVSQAAGAEWEQSAAVKAITEEAPTAIKVGDTGALAADATLKTVPAGTELKPADLVLWGQDAISDAEFARISHECQCLISVRSRSQGAIQKLERGSVWKHENLKPKNVNEIDVKYLGFKEGDLSEVRFRTYTDEQKAIIKQRVESIADPIERDEALKRMNTRFGEYKYVDPIEAMAKRRQIDVGFNYRDNGVNLESTSSVRKFDLVSADIPKENGLPAGGTYYTPYQENPAAVKAYSAKGAKLPPDCILKFVTVLCTVTGDMDGVYITKLNGTAIPPEEMVKIYEALQDAGWQHPETLTWINNEGQFLFDKKEEILRELQFGTGQALIEYAPDGIRRATYLDINKSSLLSRDKFFLKVVGGYTDFAKTAK